jgi:hypothetical protein
MEVAEFVEATTFQAYVTCKGGWLAGASEDGFACKQVTLKDAKTRVTSTWPAHGLLKMLGKEWMLNGLVGALSKHATCSSCVLEFKGHMLLVCCTDKTARHESTSHEKHWEEDAVCSSAKSVMSCRALC